jgi:uncharacterized surface protein with fasciclin (FAS1) repeats
VITRRFAMGAGGLALLLSACQAPGPRTLAEDGTIDMMSLLRDKPEHRRLVTALQVSGLNSRIGRQNGAVTLFAPTNDAMAGLPADLQALLDNPPSAPTEAQRQRLAALVSANAAFGLLRMQDLAPRNNRVVTWDRGRLQINQTGPRTANIVRDGSPAGRPPVGIVRGDVLASDGVIHVTNAPILPPG